MKKIIFIAALSFAGVLSASTGDKVSPASKTSEVVEAKPKKAKKEDKASEEDCVRVIYHGCIDATTCISDFSFEKLEEWVGKLEKNYCE
ncbi:hypothetical protein [Riemerella anatipestifer]|uniref:Uncharacterized protein n=1 Tax=Riemerella anatipestifer TaxID=34085 RepID=A0AAP3AJ94_RIEAN|nr:hypothetical protein [Riemerella anatipestifer]AZZ59294.1 hypothetical protein AWB57_09800 [Riemerella anatipestifer]MBT0551332.1 hypothetical protein [Riemerella anatipestifer]MBT0572994.1 hypothetical protein [Riemerella anatipestifer]MCE3024086.1 hypothetical protein [Riemerella anatipestifer]MCO7317902.1 hypothetical protein [Riemerella anatipestifer]